ncbi:MAG TPA: outer membrane beta-barrel protein [Gemmatimonadaceae bacterium]
MNNSVRSLAFVALALTAIPGAAQERPAARLTPYVGFLAAGSIADGPFGFEIGNAGAPLYGVQLGINLTPNLAVVGNIGYSDSELQAGLPFIGGIGLADSRMLLFDGGLQLRFPAVTGAGTGFVPYVEGGVGGINHEITVGPLRTQSTNVAFTVGGGVDLQLTSAFGLRVMAKDHMSRFDYGEAIGVANEGRRAHNWVLGLGLNLGW